MLKSRRFSFFFMVEVRVVFFYFLRDFRNSVLRARCFWVCGEFVVVLFLFFVVVFGVGRD